MNKLTIAAAALLAVLSIQCSQRSDQKVEDAQESISQDIRDHREEIKKDLQSLRDDINDRLDKVSSKIEKTSDNTRAELEATKQDLIVQRDKVEKRLDEIARISLEHKNRKPHLTAFFFLCIDVSTPTLNNISCVYVPVKPTGY